MTGITLMVFGRLFSWLIKNLWERDSGVSSDFFVELEDVDFNAGAGYQHGPPRLERNNQTSCCGN